jgi:hypothetical protein
MYTYSVLPRSAELVLPCAAMALKPTWDIGSALLSCTQARGNTALLHYFDQVFINFGIFNVRDAR